MKKSYLFTFILSVFLPFSNVFGQLNKAEVVYDGQGSESIISIHFLNEQLGFAGGNQGDPPNLTSMFLKTTDGGDNWQHVTLSGMEGMIAYLHFLDENNGFASTYQPYHFWRTTDGGSTWSEIDPIINANGYYDIHFTSSSTGFLLGMKVMNSKPKTIILKTTNGGSTWIPMDTLNGFGYIFDWADENNSAIVDLHYLRYTGDAWQTMDSIPVTQSRDVAFVAPDTLLFTETPNIFSVFANQNVTGKGSITGASDNVPFIAFANSRRGIAVGELGKIYVTENGGNSWTRINYSSEII